MDQGNELSPSIPNPEESNVRKLSEVRRKFIQRMEAQGKLTAEEVLEIRMLAANKKMKLRVIANMYGVSTRAISDIVSRKTWDYLETCLE